MRYTLIPQQVEAHRITQVAACENEIVFQFADGSAIRVPKIPEFAMAEVGDYWVIRPDRSTYISFQKSFESRWHAESR